MPAEAQFRWPGEDRRLFVGVGLNAAQQQQMAAVLATLPAAVKPVPLQNLHLTLRFLGQSSESQARQLWAQLATTVLPAFTAELDELLCWPAPKVLCLAGAVKDPALQQLDKVIDQATVKAGYSPPQHQLHPHVTLARHARQLPEPPITVPVLSLEPTQLHLYQSVSTPAGVRYPILASLPLQAAYSV